MARHQRVVRVDDLNGNENAGLVEFMLDSVQYEIDLDDENNIKLRESLAPYIAAARRKASTPNPGRSKTYQSEKKKRQNARIREWAKSRNIEMTTHGRIPVYVRTGYFRAHRTEVEILR